LSSRKPTCSSTVSSESAPIRSINAIIFIAPAHFKFSILVSGDFDGDGYADDLDAVNLKDQALYYTDLSTWIKIDMP